MTATGSAAGSASIMWNNVEGVSNYDVLRKVARDGPWQLVQTVATSPFINAGLTPGRTYLYGVRAVDAAGNHSPDSNYDVATTVDYTDPQLTSATRVPAKHLVEARAAVNAICSFAGTTICPAQPFAGSDLDETQVKTHTIAASDFAVLQSSIVSLRSAVGASAAVFRDLPVTAQTVKVVHMEDIRRGAN